MARHGAATVTGSFIGRRPRVASTPIEAVAIVSGIRATSKLPRRRASSVRCLAASYLGNVAYVAASAVVARSTGYGAATGATAFSCGITAWCSCIFADSYAVTVGTRPIGVSTGGAASTRRLGTGSYRPVSAVAVATRLTSRWDLIVLAIGTVYASQGPIPATIPGVTERAV